MEVNGQLSYSFTAHQAGDQMAPVTWMWWLDY